MPRPLLIALTIVIKGQLVESMLYFRKVCHSWGYRNIKTIEAAQYRMSVAWYIGSVFESNYISIDVKLNLGDIELSSIFSL